MKFEIRNSNLIFEIRNSKLMRIDCTLMCIDCCLILMMAGGFFFEKEIKTHRMFSVLFLWKPKGDNSFCISMSLVNFLSVQSESKNRETEPRENFQKDAPEALARCRSRVRGLFVWIPVEEADSTSRLLLIEEVAHQFREHERRTSLL